VDRQSLPLVNIVSATERRIGIPKRHFSTILLAAAALLLVGLRFSHQWQGWGLMLAGLALGLWCHRFHRRRAWVIRLNLLLNQRLGIQFSEAQDAASFLTALSAAKGGNLPVMRM
jgi:hypothetical protein